MQYPLVYFTRGSQSVFKNKRRKSEEYAEGLKVFISGPDDNPMKFEYLRFEADTPMHPDIINQVHIAYKVDKLAYYTDQ